MASAVLIGLAIFYVISGIDDLFIDIVSWAKRLGPRRLQATDLDAMSEKPQKTIAILVPAWKESGVIGRMLTGNLRHLKYASYHFFIGVYPNDIDTIREVEEVSRLHPNVHAVINDRPGPTSKGQILNHVVRSIFQLELETGTHFDVFMLHDAEDVIHPRSLALINREIEGSDFVQIPVFSFPLPRRELVAGTYADEFAESHTKDMLVRSFLGGGVPSAGVGTALSRALVGVARRENGGNLLNEGSLTEDYELGMRASRAGLRGTFACYYVTEESGGRDYIATREYFPRRFASAIRQKTRWTIGISLQGWRNLGWDGSLVQKYFLARDRKSLLTNPINILGYGFVSLAVYLGTEVREPDQWLFSFTLVLMVNRAVQRGMAAHRVYGLGHAMFTLVRVPISNIVNAMAGLRAVKTDAVAHFKKVKIAWAKTEHELPPAFGA